LVRKDSESREQSQTCLRIAEAHPIFNTRSVDKDSTS
jgi:hypothetical protein